MVLKRLASLMLACLVVTSLIAQERPKPISLIQLIATPEKFDGRQVTVNGFLLLGENPDFVGQQPLIYIHQEDARNLILANSVRVMPSDQMRRDREKIDHVYVTLTGTFHAARQGTDSYEGGTLAQIQACSLWSNPSRPIGESSDKVKGKFK